MFRTKDLAISIIPREGDLPELRRCFLGTRICFRPTILCYRWLSCRFLTPCGYLTPCPYLTCRYLTPCGILSPCGALSACPGYLTCVAAISACPFNTRCPGFTVACEFDTRPGGCIGVTLLEDDPITRVINPEVLVINEVAEIRVLREQLEQVMRALGEFEQKGLDMPTETPEELADLETKLESALKEIQARRKESGGGKK